jgi:hypothetical protein
MHRRIIADCKPYLSPDDYRSVVLESAAYFLSGDIVNSLFANELLYLAKSQPSYPKMIINTVWFIEYFKGLTQNGELTDEALKHKFRQLLKPHQEYLETLLTRPQSLNYQTVAENNLKILDDFRNLPELCGISESELEKGGRLRYSVSVFRMKAREIYLKEGYDPAEFEEKLTDFFRQIQEPLLLRFMPKRKIVINEEKIRTAETVLDKPAHIHLHRLINYLNMPHLGSEMPVNFTQDDLFASLKLKIISELSNKNSLYGRWANYFILDGCIFRPNKFNNIKGLISACAIHTIENDALKQNIKNISNDITKILWNHQTLPESEVNKFYRYGTLETKHQVVEKIEDQIVKFFDLFE